MEEATQVFDVDVLAICERKKDLAVNLKYAELTVLSMYEELQIIRATEITEDNLKKQVKELGRAVTEADQLVTNKETQLVRRTKAVQKANDQLKSIQEMIENELADNKHSEYLLKVFMMRDGQKTKAVKSEKSLAPTTAASNEQSDVVPAAIHVEVMKISCLFTF